MANDWTDRLAGARMQVDQQFNDRLVQSQFTNQEWGLIMTAVEFDIENPEDPAEAQLVARTGKVEHIMPELEKVSQHAGPGGGGGGGRDSGGGLLEGIRSLLGGGSGGSDGEKLQAATDLADEYASELQQHLENQGRWVSICRSAADPD